MKMDLLSPLIRHFFTETFDTGFLVTEGSDDDDDDDDYNDDVDYDNDCCKKITLRGSDSYPAG
jgi:hypothetical protein